MMRTRNWIVSIVVIIFFISIILTTPFDDQPINNVNEDNMKKLILSSPVFENNGKIPSRFTCDGEDINPPLEIKGVPEGTQSLVLIMDDPDASNGIWDHWVVYSITPKDQIIPEDWASNRYDDFNFSEGINSWNKAEYGGPCPGSGEHRYFFKLYALDTDFDFEQAPNKKNLENIMIDHIIEQAELMGKYKRI